MKYWTNMPTWDGKEKKKKTILNWQWFRISRGVLDDGYSLWKHGVSSTVANHTPSEGRSGCGERLCSSAWGSSVCMIESLDWVLCVYPITQAGRKFKGKYIFYAAQSKLILSLSQLFAPVSIKWLKRVWLLRNLRSKGDMGVVPG